MGTFGPGVFQNDHALDLLSSETHRWAAFLREGLDRKGKSWDDIEGLLVYVRLLALAGREAGAYGLLVDKREASSSRAIATRWRDRFLALESTVPAPDEASPRFEKFRRERAAVVKKAFRELIAVAPDDDAPVTPKARARKPVRP